MHYSTLITPLLLVTPSLAQLSCSGDIFNNYCCNGGSFVGPVISSFSASFSSRDSAMSASFSSRDSSRSDSLSAASTSREASQSSIQASMSSRFSNGGISTQDAAAQITATPVLAKRVITTEVSSGLTCIGDSASSLTGGSGVVIMGGSTSSTSSGGSATAASSDSSSTSTSTNAGAYMTQAPILAMGAAAAFAYGAM